MKRKRLSIKKLLVAFFLLVIIGVASAVGVFYYSLTPVSEEKEFIRWEITEGTSTYEIINNLESDGLIRNALIFKLYIKVFEENLLIKAGTYNLSPSMSVQEIITEFKEENYEREKEITVTFKEGLSIPKMLRVLKNEMNITEEEVMNALKDSTYLDSLIEKHWFLTDEIKSNKLYYSLEGYLFPNTYNFYENSSAKDVINKMLQETDRVLSKYRESIEAGKYSVHQILTLASIIQNEGTDSNSFKNVSSVLYNRLNAGQKLQCCTTAYYGAKLIQGEDDFGNADQKVNAYNTYVVDGIPVGPISNPGEAAIEAAVSPAKTNYYYFLSDSYLRLYFSRTFNEHINKQNELISKGMWAGS